MQASGLCGDDCVTDCAKNIKSIFTINIVPRNMTALLIYRMRDQYARAQEKAHPERTEKVSDTGCNPFEQLLKEFS